MKRSDLANFDPDTPLEKLGWAREMQRNFQQPMSARTMRVCTAVCSERWDSAEDGGGDYRRVVCCTKKRNIQRIPPQNKGKKKTAKKKEVPSIELVNFDWIV